MKIKGTSFIEVMVALFIFSVFVIGTFHFQLHLYQQSFNHYYEHVAIIQINSFLERIRANRWESMRERELLEWNKENAILLPLGKGNYQCQLNECWVEIQWFQSPQKKVSIRTLFF